MSFTHQFNQHNTSDDNGLPSVATEDYQATFAAAIGLNAAGMTNVIINDLRSMLQKNQTYSLEGYIQCLYRIVSHKTAWECIIKAYTKEKTDIPEKVLSLFHKNDNEIEVHSNQINRVS